MLQGFLLLGLAVLTLSAVTFRQKGVVNDLVILQKDSELNQHLIDQDYLRNLIVKEYGSTLVNVPVEFVNIHDVEVLYKEDPYIKTSEVYINKHGVMEVLIEERTPLMRMMDTESSFYMDRDGVNVPLSSRFSARLPVVILPTASQNMLNDAKREDLVLLINTINENDFLKALVDQVEANADGTYTIVPFLGKERIEIGTTDKLNDKLHKIILFYKKRMTNGLWNQCEKIDVRYEGQVVCAKSKKEK